MPRRMSATMWRKKSRNRAQLKNVRHSRIWMPAPMRKWRREMTQRKSAMRFPAGRSCRRRTHWWESALRSTATMRAWSPCWAQITGCTWDVRNAATIRICRHLIMTTRTAPCALSATSRICTIFSMGRAGRIPRRKCWSAALPWASMKNLQGSGTACSHSLRPIGRSCLPDSPSRRRRAICVMRSFTRKDRPAITICWTDASTTNRRSAPT